MILLTGATSKLARAIPPRATLFSMAPLKSRVARFGPGRLEFDFDVPNELYCFPSALPHSRVSERRPNGSGTPSHRHSSRRGNKRRVSAAVRGSFFCEPCTDKKSLSAPRICRWAQRAAQATAPLHSRLRLGPSLLLICKARRTSQDGLWLLAS